MKITTSRFGELSVHNDDIINFNEGLLGFENLKQFFIVDPGDKTLILWFQSIDDGKTAFPILEPQVYLPDYRINLLPAEMASLNLKNTADIIVYTALTIPANVKNISANLKAPIIINNKTKNARQIVLQDSKLEIRYPIYKDLKRILPPQAYSDGLQNKESPQGPEIPKRPSLQL